jgi:hypothetical protein
MIIQTGNPGEPRLAVLMHEHTALAGQFARTFGNASFEAAEPADLMFHVVSHHDAGWAEFDRNPVTDEKTRLPYNLIETPAAHIVPTSRGSPDFNERQHAYCGLISSMHSWGLYNGRYGLSNLVLIDNIPAQDRPIAQEMLDGELVRQARLKAAIAADPRASAWLEERHILQNYKQLQFFDTLALYFNRICASQRRAQTFEHVPRDAETDETVTITPREVGVYALSPFPFAAENAQFAFAGRYIRPGQHKHDGGWPKVLRQSPTVFELFRFVAG